jgi:lipoyl(octanoyl) transferase
MNVSTDLDAFSLIVPCGLRTTTVTSFSRETGREISLADAQARTVEQFAGVFGYKLRRS